MAMIGSFRQVQGAAKIRISEVECDWLTVDDAARGRVVVLRTMGSQGRSGGRRPSQVIELDRNAAGQLARILRESFPDL
jgi:hypothetical protein